MVWRPNTVCDETNSPAENEPFISKEEERNPGDRAKEAKKSNKNEEIKPFWITLALSTVSSDIDKRRLIISFSRDLFQNVSGFLNFTF